MPGKMNETFLGENLKAVTHLGDIAVNMRVILQYVGV
jgi:hypothetical protein